MSYQVGQSTSAYALMFLLVESADHITPLTGASPTVTLSKNGGAFASPSGAVTEVANGWYKVAGNTTDSATLGPLVLHATATSADPTDAIYEVVVYSLSTATIANVTTVTTVTNQLTAAQIATGVWQDATSADFTAASSIGKSLYISNIAPGASGGHAIGKDASGGVNVGQWLATTVATPATAGIPDVNVKNMNNVAATAITTIKAVQGLTTADQVTTVSGNVNGSVGSVTGAVGSVTGAVGSVTGNVGGNVTGSVGSVASGGITKASLAANTGLVPLLTGTASAGGATSITLAGGVATNSYYNNCLVVLTGGTGVGQSRFITAYVGSTTVATVGAWATNPDNTSTFAVLPFDAVAGATAPTVAQIATGVWQDATGSDFTASGSIGKSLFTSGNAPGAASGIALVGSAVGAAASVTAAVTVTGDFSSTMKTSLNAATPASVQNISAQTGDSYARLGAPAGASVSADLAAVKSDTGSTLTDAAAIVAQTNQLAFTTAGHVDAGVRDINGTTVNGNGSTTPWGP